MKQIQIGGKKPFIIAGIIVVSLAATIFIHFHLKRSK